MTLHLGTWAIPALITVVAFGLANLCVPKERPVPGYQDDLPQQAFMIFNAFAAIVSLAAWLIWSLV